MRKVLSMNIGVKATALALSLVVGQVAFTQLQADIGWESSSQAHAKDDKSKAREKARRTPALRNKVYEKLQEAQGSAEAKDYRKAKKVLDSMVAAGGKRTLNSYELANVYNLYAYIYYAQENYAKALQSYQQVIKQPDIPEAMEVNTKYTIAQLYFVQEKWSQGIKALQDWFRVTDKPNANAYILLGQGYYQLKDYRKALQNTQKAINMYKEAGKTPKEQWYNLARFLYFEKGDIPNTIATLEILLRLYPKKSYWVQLSHMYGEQKKETKQLAAMETAYVQGMLNKGTEEVTMAYLYLNGDVPYKAAKVMDKGLKRGTVVKKSKNYEILGNSWAQAQELKKAIPAMEEAAKTSDSGELYARLGSIYLEHDKNKKAISSINKALSRGGVKRPDTARLILGMAYFNTHQYGKARKAFVAAGKDKRSERYAKQWIKYMDGEIARQKKLEEEEQADAGTVAQG
ncbi:MAG: hypothetical protein CSA53_06240 [Gammaproteobacteria bacterium]|nr:MAG: hypothetical protein CSA53_06240 [Gammaproteobacteria bacterium]